jgi:hypothetical protein
MWHYFRWEQVDADVERALESIGNYQELVGVKRKQAH